MIGCCPIVKADDLHRHIQHQKVHTAIENDRQIRHRTFHNSANNQKKEEQKQLKNGPSDVFPAESTRIENDEAQQRAKRPPESERHSFVFSAVSPYINLFCHP